MINRMNKVDNRNAFRDAVKEALTADAEGLFRRVWGDSVKAGAADWRAKASGARSMSMRGRKRGLWRDHTSGDGGDLFDLIAVEIFGLAKAKDNFPKVLNEAAAFVGMAEGEAIDTRAMDARRAERDAKARLEAARDAMAKADLIAELQARARPIDGTPAAAYLASRGIVSLPSEGLAYAAPVHGMAVIGAARDALVVWGTDDNGSVTGGQRVLILPNGAKAPDDIRKPSFGYIGGSPARFPARVTDGPLCICEGPESALSVWQATGFETWAVFGSSSWATVTLQAGRKIILCPDQDAAVGTFPEGSQDAKRKESAARSFAAAVAYHVASGADVWIARAPEPEGSKRDLNDTLQRAGNTAVVDAIGRATPAPKGPDDSTRAKSGRFTGTGLVPFTGAIPDTTAPLPLREARAKTDSDICDAFSAFRAWDDKGPELAPVYAIKADPGIGKSTMGRRRIAEMARKDRLTGDVIFYLPTLALADEAAAHMEDLGAEGAVKRGRLAKNPKTGEQMCERAAEVERAGKVGLPIAPTMCRTIDETGTERRCPFYDSCAYQAQERELGDQPVIRFMSHAYLNLADKKDRPIMFRVIDESFWAKQTGDAAVTADELCGPRFEGTCKDGPERDARLGTIADMMEAAGAILAGVRRGQTIGQATAAYTAAEFRAFAKAEGWGRTMPLIFPDTSEQNVAKALTALEATPVKKTGPRSAFWNLLAEAKDAGVDEPQNIIFTSGYQPTKDSEPRDVVRVFWSSMPPRDKPVLILDADADTTILSRFYPGLTLSETQVKPNAYVLQITDKVFSKTTLLNSKATRQEWVGVLAVEAMRDAAHGKGGVLVVATKGVVRTFFEDAGFSFDGMEPNQINQVMMNTTLHGVSWAWFGAATLGSNRWKDCTTVAAIGREEWPPQALENFARAIWGHGLDLLKPDDTGNVLMPDMLAPFTMSDGTIMGVTIKAHPDPRVRSIQMQARELSSRQTIERLRLAQAKTPKRVIIGCSVPIPGLPVDEATTWEAFKPSRAMIALAESGSALRISAKGLTADAPMTFATEKAAAGYLERGDLVADLFNPRTPNISIITGAGVKRPVLVQFKLAGQKGRFPTRAVLLCDPAHAEAMAVQKWGALHSFEILQDANSRDLNGSPSPEIEIEALSLTAPATDNAALILAWGDGNICAFPRRPAPHATPPGSSEPPRRALVIDVGPG